MYAYISRRLMHSAVILVLATMLVFSLLHVIPGDPVLTMLGLSASPEEITRLREELWLDRPLFTQYLHWVGKLWHGDLGTSVMYGEDVSELIARRLPITVFVGGLALAVASVVGVGSGLLCAWKQGSAVDRTISTLASLAMSVPVFWLGILGIYVFALTLGWLPVQGYTSPFTNFWLSLRQLVMPVACLSVVPLAAMTRQTRAAMIEVLRENYVTTARAFGAGEGRVLMSHVLRNGLIPVLTVLGVYLRHIVGGSVIVETVFNIPGTGRMIVQAIFDKDFVVVQASVLVLALVVLLGNLAVDCSYGIVDPRVESDR